MAKKDLDIRPSDINLNMPIPSNSNLSKMKEKKVEEKKEIEMPVMREKAIKKKRNFIQKMGDSFIAEDAENVGSYILQYVVIPSIKDIITSVVKNGIDIIFYGGARPSSNRLYRDNGRTYVNYGDRYRTNEAYGRSERKEISRRDRASHNCSAVEFQNKEDAEDALNTVLEYLDQYKEVGVNIFYEAAGVETEWTDNGFGWTSDSKFNEVQIRQLRNGNWIIDLPRVVRLR